MTARRGRFGLVMLAALAAAGCSRPSWTDPATSKGSRDWPKPAARAGVSTDPRPGPALVAWLTPLIGRAAHEVFPVTGACLGNTDNLEIRYLGGEGASRVVGWAWDPAITAPVARVILTDAVGRIVGGGESGLDRPDVVAAKPTVTSPKTGWAAITGSTSGRVGAYGVVDAGRALCALGGVDL